MLFDFKRFNGGWIRLKYANTYFAPAPGVAPAVDLAVLDLVLMTSPIWLFGYGSLIWRPDFDFTSSRIAWVDGWSRRFWQGSHDHRGVPEAPGRVATLIPLVGERCGGMAFEIDAESAARIFDQLDYREKNGYERFQAPLYFDDGSRVDGVFYVANEDNHAYLGPAPIEKIAEQIKRSHGPSGSNEEYLRNLADALRQYNIEDDHVFSIESAINTR